MLKNVILIRNIFYKLFLFGLLFYIFTAAFLLFNHEWTIKIINHFWGLPRAEINFLIAYFIGWSKMIIILFFLIPAFALHWTGHSLKEG